MRKLVVTVVAVVVGALGLTACEIGPHHDFTVNVGTDAVDADPGDGVCEATVGADDCTLRAAIGEANALQADAIGPAPTTTVQLATDVTLSIGGAGEDLNATGDLDLAAHVTLAGDGHTVDADGLDRVLDLTAGSLTVRDVSIVDGYAPESGGGVRTAPGTAFMAIEATFVANVTLASAICAQVGGGGPTCGPMPPDYPSAHAGGGALFSQGSAVIAASTFVENRAPSGFWCVWRPVGVVCGASMGGAILATGDLYVGNSTFEQNRNDVPLEPPGWDFGSAIYATGSAHVVSSTFADNGRDAVTVVTGATVEHSIVVSTACAAPVLGPGGNLRSPVPCGAPGAAWLGPLADNGGPTQTRMPDAGSLAVDALAVGDCLSYGLDQRGEPRAADAPCDIGAVERQPTDP
jgi:hypothetical protein